MYSSTTIAVPRCPRSLATPELRTASPGQPDTPFASTPSPPTEFELVNMNGNGNDDGAKIAGGSGDIGVAM